MDPSILLGGAGPEWGGQWLRTSPAGACGSGTTGGGGRGREGGGRELGTASCVSPHFGSSPPSTQLSLPPLQPHV